MNTTTARQTSSTLDIKRCPDQPVVVFSHFNS